MTEQQQVIDEAKKQRIEQYEKSFVWLKKDRMAEFFGINPPTIDTYAHDGKVSRFRFEDSDIPYHDSHFKGLPLPFFFAAMKKDKKAFSIYSKSYDSKPEEGSIYYFEKEDVFDLFAPSEMSPLMDTIDFFTRINVVSIIPHPVEDNNFLVGIPRKDIERRGEFSKRELDNLPKRRKAEEKVVLSLFRGIRQNYNPFEKIDNFYEEGEKVFESSSPEEEQVNEDAQVESPEPNQGTALMVLPEDQKKSAKLFKKVLEARKLFQKLAFDIEDREKAREVLEFVYDTKELEKDWESDKVLEKIKG